VSNHRSAETWAKIALLPASTPPERTHPWRQPTAPRLSSAGRDIDASHLVAGRFKAPGPLKF